MFYARLDNGAPVEWGLTLSDMRVRLPHVSIPANGADLSEFGYIAYTPVDAPTVDIEHNVTEGPPALVDGEWVMQLVVTDATPEEIEERRRALVPASVSLWKAKAIMAQTPHGEGTLLDAVDAMMAQADAPTKLWWEYGQEIEREHPRTLQFAAALGVEGMLDDLFIAAAAIDLS